MWASFFLCAAVIVLALYLPGYLLLRGARLSRTLSLGAAPLVSVTGFCLVAIALGVVSVPCGWPTVLLPVLAAGALAFGLSWRRRPRLAAPHREQIGLVLLYLAVGTLVCLYVFVKPLDSPESFYCRFDDQTHYNLARHFVDTGDWSALHHSDGAVSHIPTSTYYPSAWHLVSALAFSLTGIDLPIVFNALNVVLAGLTYPLSSLALMTVLFPRRRSVIVAGAVATMAFACFPWVLLLKGQLLANLISFSLVPAALSLIMRPFNEGGLGHWKGIAGAGILTVAFFGLAHPNGLFTALVFLAPFLIHKAAEALRRSPRLALGNPLRHPALIWLIGAVLCYAIWQLMLYAPPLQQVVLYDNTGNLNLSWPESFYAAAAFSLYPEQPPQWVLAIVCLVGIATLVWRRRAWLALPGTYMLLVYAACRCVDAGYTLRTFLAGFWYSDPYRILCCAEIFLVPVAAAGLAAIAGFIARRARRLSPKPALTLVLATFSLVNFFPAFVVPPEHDLPRDVEGPHFVPTVGTAFGYFHLLFEEGYDMAAEQIYSADEEAFVRKAMEKVPPGALVINDPHDGSAFAYGLNGLNTYYRHIDLGTEAEESPLIRERLSELAADADVAQAVRDAGAAYVLQLDHDVPFEEGVWLIQTNEDNRGNFAGIDAIDDDTTGFEVVIEEDDKRLYRIVPPTA